MNSNAERSRKKPATSLEELKQQLAQVDGLIAEGVLKGEAARRRRDALERQVLQSLGDGTAGDGGGDGDAARPSWRLGAMVLGFVLLVGVVGYGFRGNFEGLKVSPGAADGGAAGHAAGSAEVAAMTERLAERLKSQPDDAEGWSMLARSYTVQGRFADALPAFKRVVELRPRDAQALADYADGLAMSAGKKLEGEPERIIHQALEVDPNNLKALALAGTAAFNRDDYRVAVKFWERAVNAGGDDSAFVRQLQGALAEARQRAGMTAAAGEPPATRTINGAAAASAAAADATVAGRVTLGAAAKGQVSPGDTVFVYARAASGSRMPLALIRKTVADLPLDFKLDDSLAMSPAARLSGASQVIVGARISKSGSAMPAPGDWEATSAPVPLGTRGLKLEIATAIR